MDAKKFIRKYFTSFSYFYSHLRYKIFVALGINLSVGFLDGMGLTMFLPLLQMVDQSSQLKPEQLGGLSFIVEFFTDNGIDLTLVSVLILMAAFFILKGIVQYFNGWYRVVVQQFFIKNLRVKNIRGLRDMDYKAFLQADTGRIQNTLSGEVDKVSKAYQGYFQAIQYGMMVVVYMAFAFAVDSQFALLVTAGGVVTNFVYRRIYTNTKGASRKLTQDSNFFQGLIIQFVANFKYLKATSVAYPYGDKLIGAVQDLESNNKRIGLLTSLITAAREPLVVVVVVVIIYAQTTFFGASLSVILVSLLFFYRALSYLMMVQNQWNMFISVSGSLENMTAFSKEIAQKKEPNGTQPFTTFTTDIRLANVDLTLSGTPILNNVSLTIHKNEVIAFVGESGAGKSSLVNVITGLLRPDKGAMFIDGTNSSQLDIHSFQKRIGYITQDPVIFSDTVFNNICLWDGKPALAHQRFWHVTEQALIRDFIEQLPEKENTPLGNAGLTLSGGQKQRISIARELYKDSDILIMDEATSALDSGTEYAIQENIDRLKGKYTILIVAHRLSTIRSADRIVLMNKGRIEMVDNFENLYAHSEKFSRMVKLQEIL